MPRVHRGPSAALGGHMRGRTLFATGVAIVGMLAGMLISAPANAAPIDKGHFHDVGSDFFDCDGTPVRQDTDVMVNFLFNARGSRRAFPYYRESVSGTVAWVNENTGGAYTSVFT